MAHVINRNYSKFYDVKTRVQFEPVLDGKIGSHVAHALTGADFEGRVGFEVLSDEDYLALISAPPERSSQSEPVSSGDPVRDAAAATSDSRAGRKADGRAMPAAGGMIDPESAAAIHASAGEGEGVEAGGHD